MNSRRSFFKRCATAIAVLAIAPQIAFSRKLETVAIPYQSELAGMLENCYAIAKARGQQDTIDVFTDIKTAETLRSLMCQKYKNWRYETNQVVRGEHKPVGIYEQLRQCGAEQ